jgi:tetratricopeptide (TPR) repeat protein
MRVRVPDMRIVEDEYETAAEFYRTYGRRLVEITPGSELNAFEKGDYREVLSCEGNDGSALAAFGIGGEHFEEVARIANPRLRNDRSEKYYRKALQLCKAGSPELALVRLERSVKSRPNLLASYMRASLLKSLGRSDEAAQRFESILADRRLHITREVFAGAHFHLGELLFRNGCYDEAKDHFLRCVEAIPLHKKASGYLRVISAEGCGAREHDMIESYAE